jgi:hypothetical protein
MDIVLKARVDGIVKGRRAFAPLRATLRQVEKSHVSFVRPAVNMGHQQRRSSQIVQSTDKSDKSSANGDDSPVDGRALGPGAPSSDLKTKVDSSVEEIPTDLALSPSTIRNLRETVFGLDTFFVQTVDNYGESGVLFKGNIRSGAEPSVVQKKLQTKLKEQLPNYSIFLLLDREDKATCVVIPEESARVASSDTAEFILSIVLGLTTVVTTLNVFDGEIFNAALLVFNIDPAKITAALPASLAFLGVLLLHEVGHVVGAKKHDVVLAPPVALPAGLGLLGSFGSITRIKSKVQNRQVLSDIIAPGPITGLSASLLLVLVGLGLTKLSGGGSVDLDTASFQESFLIGGLSSVILGREVFTAESVSCSPFLIAGWAGMIVNTINLIPAGELDGGKLSLATFGRPGAQFVSTLSFIALGVGSFVNGLALFWLLLVLTIQRGPGIPCMEEISQLDRKSSIVNVLLMVAPLLVLLPYPGTAPVETVDFF